MEPPATGDESSRLRLRFLLLYECEIENRKYELKSRNYEITLIPFYLQQNCMYTAPEKNGFNC
jgi:hypothetical protein